MADMITRCPKCATAFRVSDTLLNSAKGMVRCGSCLSVFNAKEHMDRRFEPHQEAAKKSSTQHVEPPASPTARVKSDISKSDTHRKALSGAESYKRAPKNFPPIFDNTDTASLFERDVSKRNAKTAEPDEPDEDESWALALLNDDSDLDVKFKKVASPEIDGRPSSKDVSHEDLHSLDDLPDIEVHPEAAEARATLEDDLPPLDAGEASSPQEKESKLGDANETHTEPTNALSDANENNLSVDPHENERAPLSDEPTGNSSQTIDDDLLSIPKDELNSNVTEEVDAALKALEDAFSDDDFSEAKASEKRLEDDHEAIADIEEIEITSIGPGDIGNVSRTEETSTQVEDSDPLDTDEAIAPGAEEAKKYDAHEAENSTLAHLPSQAIPQSESENDTPPEEPGASDVTHEDSPNAVKSRAKAAPPPKQTALEKYNARQAAQHNPPPTLQEVMANIEPEPLEVDWKNDKKAWRKRLMWPLLAITALIALAIQIAWLEFHRLNRVEPYRSMYAMACEFIGCTLPQLIDLEQIQTSNLLVRTHPEVEDALMVDVILQNNADFEQPFPSLLLTFSNIKNQPVAIRKLSPNEYLGGELAGRKDMPTRQPIHIGLEIVDPGREAVSYSIAIVD